VYDNQVQSEKNKRTASGCVRIRRLSALNRLPAPLRNRLYISFGVREPFLDVKMGRYYRLLHVYSEENQWGVTLIEVRLI